MRAWEIYTYQFPEAGPHPAVIVSHPDRVANAPLVNVLICASQRANRAPRVHEVLLNSADGLDWETFCRCDLIWLVEKVRLTARRGVVSRERQRQIVDRINAVMGWRQL
jgi:mRNA-degrading endonuclease toxin of MazEF toxin-antitoxin module